MNLFLFISTVLIWGSTWIAITFQISDVPIITSVFYRFALAAILLFAWLLLTGKLRLQTMKDQPYLFLQGLCLFCCNFLCFYQATLSVSSGLVSVIFSLATIFNAINGWLIYREKIGLRTFIAAFVGTLGLILLFSREIFLGFEFGALKGIGFAVLGTVFFSLGNMVSRRNSAAGIAPLQANCWGLIYGSSILMVLILITGSATPAPPNVNFTLALVYLSVVGTIIGFTTYLTLVARIGSAKSAYTTVLFPIVALTLSTLFEGYEWHFWGVVGVCLALCGNLIMFYRKKAP